MLVARASWQPKNPRGEAPALGETPHQKTKVFTVAKLRLADFVSDKRAECGVESQVDAGKMTFGQAVGI